MKTIALAKGITVCVDEDVSQETINHLHILASEKRHREIHGYLSGTPAEVKDGIDYENRDVACAYCGAKMPHSPWPTNSKSWLHRPRCGKCNSSLTYPTCTALAKEPKP